MILKAHKLSFHNPTTYVVMLIKNPHLRIIFENLQNLMFDMIWIYKTYNIRPTSVGNKIVDHSDVFEHRLLALLQLHLHSRLNSLLQWFGQRQLQKEILNI